MANLFWLCCGNAAMVQGVRPQTRVHPVAMLRRASRFPTRHVLAAVLLCRWKSNEIANRLSACVMRSALRWAGS